MSGGKDTGLSSQALGVKGTGGLVAFSFTQQRLGMYLEPVDDHDCGAEVVSFELVEGEPGEAERSGVIRPGFAIVKVAGTDVTLLPFMEIVGLLVASPRPTAVVFKDPESVSFLDRFGFPRPKLWCEREAAYLTAAAQDITRNELEWHEFLTKLGDGRGAGFGVMRLLRDAAGEVTFPQDPSKRLNALSPIHARMEGISGPDNAAAMQSGSSKGLFSSWFGGSSKKRTAAPPQPAEASLSPSPSSPSRAASAVSSPSSGAGAAGPSREADKADDAAAMAAGEVDGYVVVPSLPMPPIDIYKRCWGPGTAWSYYHYCGGNGDAPVAPSEVPLMGFYQRQQLAKDWTASFPIPSGDSNASVSTLPIGYHVPPGLGLVQSTLPGSPAPAKQRQQWGDQLRRMAVHSRGGGFPSAFRARMWYELSGGKALRALHPPRYYHDCLLARQPDASAANAISKDVPRTFPGHAFFAAPPPPASPSSPASASASSPASSSSAGAEAVATAEAASAVASGAGLESLTRVLSAFAVHNPSVGYCQGLNSLAGWLLLYMPEEDAFWTLEALANEILPPSYFTDGLIGLFADNQVFAHLLDEALPEVSRVVEAAGIELHTVCLEWFMCCGCSVLPTNTALRLWDLIFVVGYDQAVFRLFLALLVVNKTRILSLVASASQTGLELSVTKGEGGAAAVPTLAPLPSPSPSSPAAPSPVTVHIRKAGSADTSAAAAGKKGRHGAIETRSKAEPGVGLDSLSLEKAVSAAVAAAALLSPGQAASKPSPSASASSASSASPAQSPSPGMSRVASATAGFGSASSSSSSPAATAPSPASASAVFKGGTMRHGAQLFPAVYNLLKSMPSCAASHDVDALLRLAFPASPKDELRNAQLYGLRAPNNISSPGDASAASGAGMPAWSWDTNLHPLRISKLRHAAKQQLRGEMEAVTVKAEARRKQEAERMKEREREREAKAKQAVAEAGKEEEKDKAAAAVSLSLPVLAAEAPVPVSLVTPAPAPETPAHESPELVVVAVPASDAANAKQAADDPAGDVAPTAPVVPTRAAASKDDAADGQQEDGNEEQDSGPETSAAAAESGSADADGEKEGQ